LRQVAGCAAHLAHMVDRSSPADIEAYRLMRAGRFVDALIFAERAVAGARVCLPAHGMLATILLHLGRPRDAEIVVTEALDREPGVADAYDGLAHVSMLLGQHERSNALYRRAVEISPDAPRFWYNLASSDRSLGRLVEAEAACDRAIALDSSQYPSYLLRSELRVQTPDANHIDELQLLLRRPGREDRARVFIGYALGKELDDLRRFDDAFHWFFEAARSRRRKLSYDVSGDERKLQRIAEAYPSMPPGGAVRNEESARHIFIVGLPRSGTTLLERILTGRPAARSNGETDNFAHALMAASPIDGRDVFLRAAAANPEQVASNYEKLARTGAAEEKTIEKLPMNYLYLGAIHRALPQAKLLVVRRSPLDSCFAMYRTLFGEAYPFSYDFEELARYYAAYDRLMRHWLASFGENIHQVVYEDLVGDPLRVGAGVAHHCGLTWDSTAVDIHNNVSASLTASAAQIRRPIYGSSTGRWRHYKKHLEPLIRSLRQCGITLPDDA
jgi:tetratricopeptide (TPR) repeat protein